MSNHNNKTIKSTNSLRRCGIITFHRAINFGGLLQTYALQKFIEDIGVDCEVIDYRSAFIENIYYKNPLTSKYGLKRIVSAFLFNGSIKFNIAGFKEFTSKHINLSKNHYYSDSDLEPLNRIYDFFITGSDQVWNYYCAGNDKQYFLDFVIDNKKKNSYAASFGVDSVPQDLKCQYKNLLGSFNSISVREESGARIVYDLLGKTAKVLPDPTLLLNRQTWESIAIQNHSIGDYVLVYLMESNKNIVDLARLIGEKNDLQVIYINDNIYRTGGVYDVNNVVPEEWLGLFLNAQVVVTNSFHGIAFSINFHKTFFAYYLVSNPAVNSRIENILRHFSLLDRVECQDGELEIEKEIDWNTIDEVILADRKKAADHLINIVKQ